MGEPVGISNDRIFRAARRAGIAAIGVASAAAGLFVASRLMPDHIPATPTIVLAALIGLVVLPGMALGGWALDCRALAHAVTRVRRPARADEAALASPATLAPIDPPEPPAQRIHPPHDGGPPAHRKRRIAGARA